MTTSELTQRYSSVSTMADLLAAIPVVLGYRPRESVVVVICQSTQIEVTLRFDSDWFIVSFDLVADQLNAIAQRYCQAQIFLLGYVSDLALGEASLREAADVMGEVADMVITNGQRWWSLCCDKDCCPAQGHPFRYEDSLLSTEAVVAGVPITRERSEVVRRVAGPARSAIPDLTDMFTHTRVELDGKDLEQLLADLITLRQAYLRSRTPPSCEDCVRAAVLMDIPEALAELLVVINRTTAADDLEWLLQISAIAVGRYAINVVALLAFAAWLNGGGPILSTAMVRVQSLSPHHPVLSMLSKLMSCMTSPHSWRMAS